MPQLDPTSYPSQLFWLAVSFVVLYLLMARLALPRIAEVMEARQSRIAHDLDQAAGLKVEAEAALAAYEETMSEARSEAQHLLAQAAEARAREAAERQAALDARLAEELAEAEARIAASRDAALANVEAVAADIAAAIVARLAAGDPDPALVRSAVGAVKGGR